MSERFTSWIDAYESAWRTAGTGSLKRLFTEDASHRSRPFELTISGLDAIAEFWEAERDGPDEVFSLTYELVAAQGDIGVARVEVTYAGSRQRTYRDLWVITLAHDGRCHAFEEWPFYPEQKLTPPEDTLYDGELVDFKLYDIRDDLVETLGARCGGVWFSGQGETRRLNVAVTTEAPERTRAAAEAIPRRPGSPSRSRSRPSFGASSSFRQGASGSRRRPAASSRMALRDCAAPGSTRRATSSQSASPPNSHRWDSGSSLKRSQHRALLCM